MSTINPRLWQDLCSSFLKRYPDFIDFNQPGVEFARRELNYKRDILKRFEASDLRQTIPQLVDEGKGQEALKKIIKINFGNLIGNFRFWSNQFGSTDAQACQVLRGLLETVAHPYQGPDTLQPLLTATKQAGTNAEWDILKLLWLYRPEDYCPVPITKMRTLAGHLEWELASKKRFSIEHYPPLREFVLDLKSRMIDWKPQDMIDVQSVLWDMTRDLSDTTESDESAHEEDITISVKEAQADYTTAVSDQIWTIAAGENARFWGDWQKNGYIAVGWDIGDASTMRSKDAVKAAMMAKQLTGGMNDTLAVYQFAHKMQIGDMVFVKQGRNQMLGWGIVTSQYLYEAGAEYPHRRSIDWQSTMIKDLPGRSFATKTLTLIRDSSPYYQLILSQYNLLNTSPNKYTRKDALRDLFMPEAELDKILAQLRRRKNIILQGPPGVGKTFIAKRLAYLMMEEQVSSRVKMVQFHQSYGYEDFIQGFRPCADGSFSLQNGHFYDFCKLASSDEENDYFFIIDEINRGNLSKIFGELLMLLEHDKRGSEHSVRLAYSSRAQGEPDEFYIPDNVHVIGTMNTADKSLAIVDFAMRRRFAFVTLQPQFGEAYRRWMQDECEAPAEFVTRLVSRINNLNEVIAQDRQLGAGSKIGHSFFTADREYPPEDWAGWLEDIVRCEIEPLLNEYWPDDPTRAEEATKTLLD